VRTLLTLAVFTGLCGATEAQTGNKDETPVQGDGTSQKNVREVGHRVLDELRTSPKPVEQGDLNTFTLASAHRERAASMEEKTNGLWQSWLVSICQGCGSDRMPAADRDGLIYAKKVREQQGRAPTGKARYTYFYPTRMLRSGNRQMMADNLSNENIDQIRRDPNR